MESKLNIDIDRIASVFAWQTNGKISKDNLKKLCAFLATKYLVRDIGISYQYSPDLDVDEIWHEILLRPKVYERLCQDIFFIVFPNEKYFPGIVDHNPDAEDDEESVKRKRREKTKEVMKTLFGRKKFEVQTTQEDIYNITSVDIKLLNGTLFTLNPITSSTTIKELKKMIQKRECIPIDDQRLIYAGVQLEDDMTLSQYNIKGGYATIFMVVRKSKNEIEDDDDDDEDDDDDLVLDNVSDVLSIDLDDEDEIPNISVKTLTGKIIDFYSLSSSITVLELKQRIQDKEGIPPDQNKLIFKGEILDDESTLKDCKIRNNSKLFCVLKLRGC